MKLTVRHGGTGYLERNCAEADSRHLIGPKTFGEGRCSLKQAAGSSGEGE
jgi:hypothetical protein